jgi:DNA-binding NtrC family response regulator
LPVEPWRLEAHCAALLEAAAGGTLFLMDVDEMPANVQGVLIELLAGLQRTRGPSAAVRLISGTTVSLFGRVAGGSFSDRLFYRLNVLHLVVGHATGERRRDMAEPGDDW